MKMSKQEEALVKEMDDRRKQKIVSNVMQDFQRRREERRSLESAWILNRNFFGGNQYCDVSPFGGVEEEDKQFFWQTHRVFNHIAPTVESRLTKLEKLRPDLRVRAFSDEEGDVKAAQLATGVLKYAQERIAFTEIASRVTVWSEVCGSGFYKIAWDEQGGKQVAVDEQGAPVYEGEISVSAVSPFEIYPDRLNVESIAELDSIIHAKAVSTEYIFDRFGVEVAGETVTELSLQGGALGGEQYAAVENGVVLVERYTRPSTAYPKGRVEIVAGNTLLYEGDLPYRNGERGERIFPFVKQDCMRLPGAFFGSSIVERLIPVQRAYNAVRNRKHEFLNRLSMGVLTVEDGSVDTDELAEEGLLPGKILVYRQGGKAPEMLDCGKIPAEFAVEEEWLENEFALISGVSELSQNSTPMRVTSATGLQLLLAQDEARLSTTIHNVEWAMKEVGRQILRLYKQFAGTARLMTFTGENKRTQIYYFNAADLSVTDIQFETKEISSPEEKREVIFKLYEAGLLSDDDGKVSIENKNRILQAFGFGSFENARDISALHIAKAGEENLQLKSQELAPDVFDAHALHITEHTRFLLSEEFKKCADKEQVKALFLAHIQLHKQQME